MAFADHQEDVERFLESLAPTVRRNLKVIPVEDSPYTTMLHISKDTDIKKFIPIIGFRQAKSEDRTVPRICVAPTIMQCLYGYAAAEYDFLDNAPDGKKVNDGWKGGWKIYQLPFDVCFQPNKRLVYDADESGEHWLVAYNKETAEYIPRYAGKLFVTTIQYSATGESKPKPTMVFYLEVVAEEGLHLSPKMAVKKGFYQIMGNWEKMDDIVVEPVSATEYAKAKRVSAALLSDSIPASLSW